MAGPFPTPNVGDGWTPAFGVLAAEQSLGHDELIDWCLSLLDGSTAGSDPATPSLRWIGGEAAGTDAARDYWAGDELGYWPRVWAARALRYVWDERAAAAVTAALADDAWRVREHAATVAGLREIADAAGRLAALADPDREQTPRVRVAAVRALALVGEYEQVPAVRQARSDPAAAVRETAERTLRDLAERLDRPLD